MCKMWKEIANMRWIRIIYRRLKDKHDFVVIYRVDGAKTYRMKYDEACGLADIFSGNVIEYDDVEERIVYYGNKSNQ